MANTTTTSNTPEVLSTGQTNVTEDPQRDAEDDEGWASSAEDMKLDEEIEELKERQAKLEALLKQREDEAARLRSEAR